MAMNNEENGDDDNGMTSNAVRAVEGDREEELMR